MNPSVLVSNSSTISIDLVLLPPRMPLSYWVLYKPRQVLTSHRRSNRDPANIPLVTEFFQQIPNHDIVLPVGRLDLESEGCLVLTNDGSLNRILTSPDFGVSKSYRCLAGRDVTKGCIESDLTILLSSLIENDVNANVLPDVKGTQEERTTAKRKRLPTSDISCVSVELHDQQTYPRVDVRATSNTQLIVVDITMNSGKNREVRRLLKSLGFRTFMLCRIAIQGLIVSVDLPTDVVGVVRHVQREAGVLIESKKQKQEEEKEKEPLSPQEVAWVRDQSDGVASSKQAYDVIRQKAHHVVVVPSNHSSRDAHVLQPGGLRALMEEEIDALFGQFVSKKHER